MTGRVKRMEARAPASRATFPPLMAPGTRRVRLDRQGRVAPSRSSLPGGPRALGER